MMGRRMRAGTAVLAALVAISLTGCNEGNTPTDYNALTNQNFLELCTNHLYDLTDDTTLTQTGNTIAKVDAPSAAICQCQYDVFVNQVPINKNDTSKPNYSGPNFTDLNASLKTDPEGAWNSVPASVKEAVATCNTTGGSSSTATTTAAPTTTQAATPQN